LRQTSFGGFYPKFKFFTAQRPLKGSRDGMQEG